MERVHCFPDFLAQPLCANLPSFINECTRYVFSPYSTRFFWYRPSSTLPMKSCLFPYDLRLLAPVRIFPFSTKEVVMANSNSHHRMDDHSPTRFTQPKWCCVCAQTLTEGACKDLHAVGLKHGWTSHQSILPKAWLSHSTTPNGQKSVRKPSYQWLTSGPSPSSRSNNNYLVRHKVGSSLKCGNCKKKWGNHQACGLRWSVNNTDIQEPLFSPHSILVYVHHTSAMDIHSPINR